MPEPLVTIIGIDKETLSDEPAYQNGILKYSFNIDVSAYSVRAMGTDQNTGKNCDYNDKFVSTQATVHSVASASNLSVRDFASFVANTEISSEISYYELYQEGANQVNVYGKSLDGIWTSYQQT